LLKPEGTRGLEYLGEDWGPYETRLPTQVGGQQGTEKRLIALARLVNTTDNEQFKKEIGAYLDVDAFLRFLAVNALIVNIDSFLAGGHNFYLYLRPETNQSYSCRGTWMLPLALCRWQARASSRRT